MNYTAKWSNLVSFFKVGLWKMPTRDMPLVKRLPLNALKILIGTVRAYLGDNSALRATALTLNTLLSIVPVLALLFGIAKGFGVDRKMEASLLAHFPQQQQVLEVALQFARRAIDNTQGGLIAGAGVLFLIYSVARVIGQIEQSMNQIWLVAKPRSLARKFSDYLSLLLIGPFLILGIGSLNVFISTWVNRATEAAPLTRVFGPVGRIAIHSLPLLLLWLLFSFFYMFMPNTKVKVSSGLLGAAVAALAYQAAQSLYINLQIGVSRSSAIYGSFAAVPLFIMWVEISWNILLFGAVLTYQHQHFDDGGGEAPAADLNFRTIKRIGLDVCHLVFTRFQVGKEPAAAEQIEAELGLPPQVVSDALRRLVSARVISETVHPDDDSSRAYQPAQTADTLTPLTIVRRLEAQGQELPISRGERYGQGEKILSALDAHMENINCSLDLAAADGPGEV